MWDSWSILVLLLRGGVVFRLSLLNHLLLLFLLLQVLPLVLPTHLHTLTHHHLCVCVCVCVYLCEQVCRYSVLCTKSDNLAYWPWVLVGRRGQGKSLRSVQWSSVKYLAFQGQQIGDQSVCVCVCVCVWQLLHSMHMCRVLHMYTSSDYKNHWKEKDAWRTEKVSLSPTILCGRHTISLFLRSARYSHQHSCFSCT